MVGVDGQRLRNLREDADLTQEQLGKIVMLSKHSISSFELGKNEPKDDIKIKFAKHFKVSVDYLLGLTNDPKPHWGNSGYLRLPPGFPPQAKQEAEEYLNYLTQKHSKK